MDSYTADVRFGLRQLRLNPMFTLVAVLSLALGIGANTAIFQLIDAIRLRALPVANPAGTGLSRLRQEFQTIGLVVHPQRDLHIRQLGQHSQASAGVFASDCLEREAVQSRARRQGAIRGRSVRQRRFLQRAGAHAVVGPRIHSRRRSAGLRFAGRGDRLFVLAVRIRGRSGDHQPHREAGWQAVSDHRRRRRPSFLAWRSGINSMWPCRSAPIPCSGSRARATFPREPAWWLSIMGRLKPGWTIERANAQIQAISPASCGRACRKSTARTTRRSFWPTS